MAIEALLRKTHLRRIFFAWVLSIAVSMVLVRYLLLPLLDPGLSTNFAGFLAQLLDALVTSLLVTVAIGASLFWITPKIVKQAVLETIEPRELPALFERSLQESEFWYYKGGTGRYLRAKTVPLMAGWARSQSNTRRVKAVILDPTDDQVCLAYANYRSSTASASVDGDWTVMRVKMELLATVFVLSEYARREQLLHIELTVSSAFSSFRIDLGENCAIVTREDRQAPAMKCDRDTFFYNAYRDEIVLTERIGRKLRLDPNAMVPLVNMDVEGAKSYLCRLGLTDTNFADSELEQVLGLSRDSRDPYARVA